MPATCSAAAMYCTTDLYSATDDAGRGSPAAKENEMKLSPQTRYILRRYEALVNAQCRTSGLKELRTEEIMDEICYFMTCQSAVYIGGHFIQQDGKG